MRLYIKKIIAREFLVLVLVSFLCGIGFLLTYPYNAYQKNQVNRFSSAIGLKEELFDSIYHFYKLKYDKQNWFFTQYSNEFGTLDYRYNSKEKVWNRLSYLSKNDSIAFKWNRVWDADLIKFHKEIGFQTPQQLDAFIKENSMSLNDSASKNSALKVMNEIDSLRNQQKQFNGKILSYEDQINFSIMVWIVFACLLFGLRFLYYAIRWSIVTLKQDI